ncbi:MAG: TolC family protein [Acidovorax sp.]
MAPNPLNDSAPRGRRRWAARVAAFVLCGADAAAAQTPLPLSFEQAAGQLAQMSDALAAADANTLGKRELSQATRSLRLPEVSIDAREMKYQKTLEVPLGAAAPLLQPFGVPDPLRLTQGGWRFRPTLAATMPLYTGGQISAAQAASDAAVRQAEAERESTAQTQTLQLVQAYFGQQLAARALAVRADVQSGLERHLQDAEALERNGMATRAQRLQATVARDQAVRDREKATGDLDTLRATLARLLRSAQPIEPRTPLFVLSGPAGSLEQFQQAARDQHPQLAKLRAQIQQAEQGVRVQEGKLKPQVYLFAQRDLYRRDAMLTDADWALGIGVKFTLLSPSDRPRQIDAARAQQQQAEAGLREAENQVAIGVTQAWNQVETARKQFALLDSSLEQTRENLRLQTLSFREGQATSLDVIDARLRLGGAEIDRAQAAYQYDVALAQLLEVSGQIARFSDYLQRADKVIAP